MDIFAQKRFMTWAIIILVILNLSALATMLFFVYPKPLPPPPPPQERGQEEVQYFLKKELNLSEEQAKQFRELGEQHNMQSRSVQNETHRFKREIMDELFASQPDTVKVERLANEIGIKEAEKEKLLFHHFMDLASVCDQEQKEKFKALIHDLLDMIRPPEPKKPPKGRPLPKRNPPKR